MQATGIKRARSPDDDGTCCGGARSAKSGRRRGGSRPGGDGRGSGSGGGPRGGPSTSTPGGGGGRKSTPGGGGGGASSGAPGSSGFNPGAHGFVPRPGVVAPGPGGGVAPGAVGIDPYAEAGEEEEAEGDDVMDAGEGGEMDDKEGDEMDIDDGSVNDNNSGSATYSAIYDRAKVWNKYGADRVKTWSRSKIILYLPNLPSTFDSQWDQNPNFTVPLFQALRDALEGPDAVVDLTGLGADQGYNRVLGNRAAGRLFATLYGHNRRLFASKKSAIQNLKRIEGQRPIADKQHTEEQALWQSLLRLDPDVDKASWVWELLREASRRWMDTRFRNLRMNARRYNDGTPRDVSDLPTQPFGTAARVEIINTFVHGGDLRLDALMCQLNFGPARHRNRGYGPYMEELFEYYYGMSSEVGIWLSENALQESRGADWMNYVYTINAYVIARDAMLGNRGRNYSTVSFGDIHEQLFFPYSQRVADLVNFAKDNPNRDVDANLVAEADRYRYTLETISPMRPPRFGQPQGVQPGGRP
ncbi:hypothetical protein FJTKL_07588 [Diaporthe vaccinii]|uniref:Uncharacterized protein n=1 Tax=Diaporthe vaccinii TaxID=105482 RepID=A0ABR4DRH7_9PEZI